MPSTTTSTIGAGSILIASMAFFGTGATYAAGSRPQTETPASVAPQAELFDQFCLGCHNQQQQSLGNVPIALDTLDLSDIGEDAATWEKVVRKMRAGMMPPAGMRRPDQFAHDDFIAFLEAGLDQAGATRPNPGRTESLHRLNRVEYQNAIRDLLGLELDVTTMVPSDDASYGFDNIAGVLKMSPTLMERYLTAAQKISRLAVGTPPPFPAIDYFRVADDLSQDTHLPGLSLGTRGGTKIRYVFPMDAEYTIRAELSRDLNESLPFYSEPQNLEVSIDGERVQVFTIPGLPEPPESQLPEPAPAEPDVSANDNTATGSEDEGNEENEDETPRPQISQVASRGPRLGPEERAAHNRVDSDWEVRVQVPAGTHDVQVAFVKLTSALNESVRLPFLRPYPAGVNIPEGRMGNYLRSVEISGPYNPTGAGTSPSRGRVFTCYPEPGATRSEETACAESILGGLARRAYRRPVTDGDLTPLLDFYVEGRNTGEFDDGIERAIRRLLVSPEFLFRVTVDPVDIPESTPYRIDDIELASRLSFFLWSSIPDDELLGIAENGVLGDPQVLEQQVERMVDDSRFGSFISNFAGQWLFLRNLDATVPVQSFFPDFDDTLRQAFRMETELFFESVVREDRSAFDLLRANHTYLNERLATHYGVPNIKGSHFRRVELDPTLARRGLLGQGSILTVTAYPDRTSPVVRGKWILENLFGSPPPAPPPNVPELEPTSSDGTVLSMRERMEQHRANPVCASCHAMMDPLGLSLENFDAVGRWRSLGESGNLIDATGGLPDGTTFVGPDGLRQALLSSDLFVVTLTEKLMIYALGRGLEYYDAPAVRSIVRDTADYDYQLSSIIMGIVESMPFQMRMTQSAIALE
jgi:hypothetical protein